MAVFEQLFAIFNDGRVSGSWNHASAVIYSNQYAATAVETLYNYSKYAALLGVLAYSYGALGKDYINYECQDEDVSPVSIKWKSFASATLGFAIATAPYFAKMISDDHTLIALTTAASVVITLFNVLAGDEVRTNQQAQHKREIDENIAPIQRLTSLFVICKNYLRSIAISPSNSGAEAGI